MAKTSSARRRPTCSWRSATERALYADGGFYRGQAQPSRHFRTSARSEAFAAAVLTLALRVDRALGHPPRLDLVDMAAGGGELVSAVVRRCPAELRSRLRPVAVERASRPDALPPEVAWERRVPDGFTGLLIANEWLDNVPVDVVELCEDGVRTVLVDPVTGAETAGPRPTARDGDWLHRWWPLTTVGARAEIGLPRDEAWASAVRTIGRGVMVAVDYAHERSARPPWGSMAGFRDGYRVSPVPDGSCDVTAHVAIDACAAAGVTAGAESTLLASQREVLRSLGLRGVRPPLALADADPARYLGELAQAAEQAELIDRGGLGSFRWLVQAVGVAAGEILPVAESA